ncbi:MAG: hypothetical protein WBD56_03760 [Anaerolineales bacterium]
MSRLISWSIIESGNQKLIKTVGTYRFRAIYYTPDGSQVVFNILNLRIRPPLTHEDETVAELYFGEDQGGLLYLLGSEAKFLKQGNNAFEAVLEEHDNHPLAVYNDMVKGINAGGPFKNITPEN